ncbi:hypothetical protein [Sphaerimonospora mesophila]|uniref:hypothetical protein n=1 Tax=Sphaerimonospora mesophila TaxID=37483 RepID=UPI0006E1FF16
MADTMPNAINMLSQHLGITAQQMAQRLAKFIATFERPTCPGCGRDIARRLDSLIRYHRAPNGKPCQASGTPLEVVTEPQPPVMLRRDLDQAHAKVRITQ